MTHTPLPWKILRQFWPMTIKGKVHQITSNGKFPTAFVPSWDEPEGDEVDGTEEALANAAFIVKACNSYYETQARLAEAEKLITKMGGAIYMAQHHSENANGHDPKDLNWEIVNDLCKGAIASAEAFLAPSSPDGESS